MKKYLVWIAMFGLGVLADRLYTADKTVTLDSKSVAMIADKVIYETNRKEAVQVALNNQEIMRVEKERKK